MWNEVRPKEAVVRNTDDFRKILHGKNKLAYFGYLKANKTAITRFIEKLPITKSTRQVNFVKAILNKFVYYKTHI